MRAQSVAKETRRETIAILVKKAESFFVVGDLCAKKREGRTGCGTR